MSPLSKWTLSKEDENKVKGLFLNELVRINETGEMNSLLKALLTGSEFMMIAKRLVAFALIDEEYSDVQIAKILHLTRATVSRFRLIYKHAEEKQEPVVQKVRELKASELLIGILKIIIHDNFMYPRLVYKPKMKDW